MLSICWKNSSGPAAKVFVTAMFHRRNGQRIPIQQRHFTPVTRWKPSETSQLHRCCTKVASPWAPYAGKPNLSCVPEPEETFEDSMHRVVRIHLVHGRSCLRPDGFRSPFWHDLRSHRRRDSE